MLARNIARLEHCTGFRNTGVIEDEGQYLQDVYQRDIELGGIGRYGFNPRAHLTETSNLLTPANVAKLRASWHAHWDRNKTICIEKTPANLLMTRFLQAAFPNVYFVVIRRHPVAVSMASQKWSLTSLHSLFEHWLRCHHLFALDKAHLAHVYELTYEEYVENPAKEHQQIADFLGTRVITDQMESLSSAHNRKYLAHWHKLLTNSRWKPYYLHIASKYERRFAKYNYSLIRGLNGDVEDLEPETRSLSAQVGCLYRLAVGVSTFIWRLHGSKMELLTKPIRSIVPSALKNPIKRALRRKYWHWAARLLAPRWFKGIRTSAP